MICASVFSIRITDLGVNEMPKILYGVFLGITYLPDKVEYNCPLYAVDHHVVVLVLNGPLELDFHREPIWERDLEFPAVAHEAVRHGTLWQVARQLAETLVANDRASRTENKSLESTPRTDSQTRALVGDELLVREFAQHRPKSSDGANQWKFLGKESLVKSAKLLALSK